MNRQPAAIEVLEIHIDDAKAAYIEAAHGVTRSDVLAAFAGKPRYFVDRLGRYAMIGPVPSGRFLLAAIMPLADRGAWRLITAHWLRLNEARRVYGGEER